MDSRPVLCDHCADVIGVYEPAVVIIRGEMRETSRAVEPDLGEKSAKRYHRACYLERPSAASAASSS
jgi:hypothetical protein